MNPSLLAWAYIFGYYDFNNSPLILPETKVILHYLTINLVFSRQKRVVYWTGIRTLLVNSSVHTKNIADTVDLIPKMVQTRNTGINMHLKYTADDRLYILKGKSDILSPVQIKLVQGALIKISQLLHYDKSLIIESLVHDNLSAKDETGKFIADMKKYCS